jgi:hypothetical protein
VIPVAIFIIVAISVAVHDPIDNSSVEAAAVAARTTPLLKPSP